MKLLVVALIFATIAVPALGDFSQAQKDIGKIAWETDKPALQSNIETLKAGDRTQEQIDATVEEAKRIAAIFSDSTMGTDKQKQIWALRLAEINNLLAQAQALVATPTAEEQQEQVEPPAETAEVIATTPTECPACPECQEETTAAAIVPTAPTVQEQSQAAKESWALMLAGGSGQVVAPTPAETRYATKDWVEENFVSNGEAESFATKEYVDQGDESLRQEFEPKLTPGTPIGTTASPEEVEATLVPRSINKDEGVTIFVLNGWVTRWEWRQIAPGHSAYAYVLIDGYWG